MTHTVTVPGTTVVHPVAGSLGKLAGTVTADAAPLERRVTLLLEVATKAGNLRRPSLLYIASQISEDGAFVFLNLDADRRYTVQAYDSTGTYDPVIKGGLIPGPM
jgi:hypothetical protein